MCKRWFLEKLLVVWVMLVSIAVGFVVHEEVTFDMLKICARIKK